MSVTKIQLRRDTATNWSSNNPVLDAGELGIDTTNKIAKIGDGSTAWSSLDALPSLTATQTLTNKTISGSSNTLTNIGNSSLTNSTISGVSLGSTLNALTIGTGLSGTSYDGSSAITIANTGVTSISGTSNQISASSSTGGVTLSLPSSITTPGDLTVTGNLTVSGTQTIVNTSNLAVSDSLIYLADTQYDTDVLDIGIYGAYGDSNPGHFHTGLFRDASDGKWKLISNGAEPTDSVVDLTGVTYDTLKVGTLEGNVTGNLTGNVTGNVSGNAGTVTNGIYTTTTSLPNVTSVNGTSIPLNGTLTTSTSTFNLGTTSIALNRSSASQSLTGISIDGNAGTVTNGVYTNINNTISGTLTANSFIPASSTVPTNGVFLPAANSVGIATNSVEGIRIDANGDIVNITSATLTSANVRYGDGTNTYANIQGNYLTSGTTGSLVFQTRKAGTLTTALTIDGSSNITTSGGIFIAKTSSSTQTTDLIQIQNSTGTVIGGTTSAGQVYVNAGTVWTPGVARGMSSLAFTSTTATITYTIGGVNNPLSVGQVVTLAGFTPAGYNGTYTIQSVGGVSGAWTFTINNTTNATATAIGSGSFSSTVSISANVMGGGLLVSNIDDTNGLNPIIMSASNGVPLFWIDKSGGFTARGSSTMLQASLNLSQGDGTINPLKFTSGTNLTTAVSGVVEYDGTNYYTTPASAIRSAIPSLFVFKKPSTTTLATNSTSPLSLLAASTAASASTGIALSAATTYEFEVRFVLTTSGTTSHTEAVGFYYSGTTSFYSYEATRTVANVATSATQYAQIASGTTLTSNNTNTVMTPAITTTQTNAIYVVRGWVTTNAAGNWTPTMVFSAGPGGTSTVQIGTTVKLTPYQSTTGTVNISTWA